MGAFATDQPTKYVPPMGGTDKNDDGSSSDGIPTLLGGASPDSFGDDGSFVRAKAGNDDVQMTELPDTQAQPGAGSIGSAAAEPAPDSPSNTRRRNASWTSCSRSAALFRLSSPHRTALNIRMA